MARQENQRVMLTRRLIREGLMELLKTESIHKISVRALCEGAGINRSTFYRYYGSQYDVLAEMEEQVLGDVGLCCSRRPAPRTGRPWRPSAPISSSTWTPSE